MLAELVVTGVLLLSTPFGGMTASGNTQIDEVIQTTIMSDAYDVNQDIKTSAEAVKAFYPHNRYMQVSYQNNTDKEAKIFIQDRNGQNIILPLIVEANGQDSFILNDPVVPYEMYNYSITSPGGALIPDGYLTIRSASTKQELQPTKVYDVDRDITTSIEAVRSFYPGKQYIKIFYENHTDKEAKIFIQDKNGQNIAPPLLVKANEQKSFILNDPVVPYEMYNYSITSPGGALIPDGHLTIRSASTKQGLER